MNEGLLRALKNRRTHLHEGWVQRLRAAPVNSPLAHPDTLIHLMNATLDQVFHELEIPSARKRQPAIPREVCHCGLNPLLMYFSTAALTFQHTLAQCSDEQPVSPADADLVERALTRVARREITVFCALCRQNGALTPPARGCVPDKPSAPRPRPCETRG